MTPIKIPELCKPGIEVIQGYTGGMALYLAHWESVLCLYQPANISGLACLTLDFTPLN